MKMSDVTVNDANVFIDLHSIDLLETFFKVSTSLHTTDFIVNELKDNKDQNDIIKQNIENGNLIVKNFESMELMELIQFQQTQTSNVSLADCSVWLYAKQNDFILLTGDGRLRRDAQKDNVQVKGILFVFEILLMDGLITHKTAIDKLNLLLSLNKRLPKAICKNKIDEWSKHI